MTPPPPVGAAVVDTNVVSWLLDERPNPLAERYRSIVGGRPIVLAVQTVMEPRYGALRAGWGELRSMRLERALSQLAVVQPDDEMLTVCAQLRERCQASGHGLAAKVHDGDRWVAATALRLDVPLVSHDAILRNVTGLRLLSALKP